MSKVVIQDDMRGEAPYFVYEVDDDGTVVTTLGNFETEAEAVDEANAYASAGGLEVQNDVPATEEAPAESTEPAPDESTPETPAAPAAPEEVV